MSRSPGWPRRRSWSRSTQWTTKRWRAPALKASAAHCRRRFEIAGGKGRSKMGFSNQPKILRGAFIEFGLSLPPLIVVFQFNPLTITRTRSATVRPPQVPSAQGTRNLSATSKPKTKPGLFDFRPAGQTIQIKQETLSFDIRLDATDKLNVGDTITEQFGISPQLSTLELMMAPKGGGLLEGAVSLLLGS